MMVNCHIEPEETIGKLINVGFHKKTAAGSRVFLPPFLGVICGFDALMSGLFNYYLAGSVVYGHHVDTGGEMQA